MKQLYPHQEATLDALINMESIPIFLISNKQPNTQQTSRIFRKNISPIILISTLEKVLMNSEIALPPTRLIAGHYFQPSFWSLGKCSMCGRYLVDILGTSREDIGKLGIAHTGILNEAEYNQIEQERNRLWTMGGSI